MFYKCHQLSLCGIFQRLMLIKPFCNRRVLLRIQLHLDRLQRLNIQDVVRIIQRRLFIVKWRKTHALEVTSVSLLTTHHDPHRAGEKKKTFSVIITAKQIFFFYKYAAQSFNLCSESHAINHRHLPPLSNVHRLNHPWDFVYKGNSACDVVEHWNISDLLPGHGHVLQKFEHCMGHIFQGPANKKANDFINNDHT